MKKEKRFSVTRIYLCLYLFGYTESNLIVRKAVQQVLMDKGFDLPSVPAQNARKSAKKLLEWCSDSISHPLFERFAANLVSELITCFKLHRNVQREREHLWQHFFKLRASSDFKRKWSSFLLESIGESASPIFFQYVTERTFETMLKSRYQFDKSEKSTELQLSYQEKNAIRYTAGYVTRALVKKLKRSAHPLKEEMVCCLVEMNGPEENDTVDESEDWTRLINRGGLTQVGNLTYGVFLSMELAIRQFLSRDPSQFGSIKAKLKELIQSDDDIHFYWAIVSVGWEEEESQVLLEQIIQEYVTIRGFSFASAWMEKYKKAQKKTIQKSKGVRKELMF